DDSARRLDKGAGRPVFPLAERMEVLEAIEFVDFIIPFSEDTPLQSIKNLHRVDVLVKGGDYRPGTVVGREEVENSGGRLLLFAFKSDYSSSALIDRVKSGKIGKVK
ncbi:MAG: D-glycero-beta-D-manno-heptose 1-phosphate adenylyltransferase, partial [Candidatus Aminicenantes bacterium]|nr:D-glycero-beta-D-manno-heptose 1-phosphate adenylyltransferase [Candidatus Aminicenantes bacterium]